MNRRHRFDPESPKVQALFRAIVSLRDQDECAKFLRDLCTERELETLAERWEIARLLAGGATTRAITERTGASSATTARVRRWLDYGAGGFSQVLARITPESALSRGIQKEGEGWQQAEDRPAESRGR